MKVVSSLKSLKKRDINCKVVRRRGKLYVINKKKPKFKARQGQLCGNRFSKKNLVQFYEVYFLYFCYHSFYFNLDGYFFIIINKDFPNKFKVAESINLDKGIKKSQNLIFSLKFFLYFLINILLSNEKKYPKES